MPLSAPEAIEASGQAKAASHEQSEGADRTRADYEVGYGKPPKHTRFTPGQSGNPKGRPKGTRNFKTDLKATLKAPVKVTRDGKPRKVSTQEAMLLRLREKALAGDARALDRLISLAQTYNNEELTAASGMSADDTMLLELFKSRVKSGMVDAHPSAEKAASEDGFRCATQKHDQARAPEKRLSHVSTPELSACPR